MHRTSHLPATTTNTWRPQSKGVRPSAPTTLSKFDYTYSADGNILTWRQQSGTDAVPWDYGYDAAEQLTRAVKKSTDPTPSILKRYAYAYDAAGNRTIEQIDDAVIGASHNNLNRLTSQQPSGAIRVTGTVNEAATVSIQGQPASVSSAGVFDGTAVIPSGTSTFTISATDTNNNVTSKSYEIENTGPSKTFAYDANGNLTADGTRTFEWDARNQLVAVTTGIHRSEFIYDGHQRRIRTVEKENGITQSGLRVLWCEKEICEERAADGATVMRRAFLRGEQVSGASRYFTTDHLGSVTDVTDSTNAVLARYAFDPSGRRTLTAGINATKTGFTGHLLHEESQMILTLRRAYSQDLGRWISEDPIGFQAGFNLFRYVDDNPINFTDPDGLLKVCCRPVKALESKCHCWILLDDGQTLGAYRFGPDLKKIPNHTDDRPSPPGSTCTDVPTTPCKTWDVVAEFAKQPETSTYSPWNTSNTPVSRALKVVPYNLPACAMGRK